MELAQLLNMRTTPAQKALMAFLVQTHGVYEDEAIDHDLYDAFYATMGDTSKYPSVSAMYHATDKPNGSFWMGEQLPSHQTGNEVGVNITVAFKEGALVLHGVGVIQCTELVQRSSDHFRKLAKLKGQHFVGITKSGIVMLHGDTAVAVKGIIKTDVVNMDNLREFHECLALWKTAIELLCEPCKVRPE